MSLDKNIQKGTEHRKQYKGSKAIDKTCRNHGGCLYCENNRKHNNNKKLQSARLKIKEHREDILK